jgi:hypothetical protein
MDTRLPDTLDKPSVGFSHILFCFRNYFLQNARMPEPKRACLLLLLTKRHSGIRDVFALAADCMQKSQYAKRQRVFASCSVLDLEMSTQARVSSVVSLQGYKAACDADQLLSALFLHRVEMRWKMIYPDDLSALLLNETPIEPCDMSAQRLVKIQV